MSRITFILGSLAMMAMTSHCFDPSVIALNRPVNPPAEEENRFARQILLSGRTISPQQQCLDRYPGYFIAVCSVEDLAQLCADLKCTAGRGDLQHSVSTGPALNGTWCGDGKICYNQECVEDREPLVEPLKIIESISCVHPETFGEAETSDESSTSEETATSTGVNDEGRGDVGL